MHLQIKALKVLMKAKRKAVGTKIPQINFVEVPLPDVNTLALEKIDISNPFFFFFCQLGAYFKRLRD